MRYYIVGLNFAEAQGYAMRFKEEHRGKQVRVLTVEGVRGGALRGLGGEDTEVIILPRAWGHSSAITLGLEAEVLEQRGVRVTTPSED
jgi:hypothetical protein